LLFLDVPHCSHDVLHDNRTSSPPGKGCRFIGRMLSGRRRRQRFNIGVKAPPTRAEHFHEEESDDDDELPLI